MTEGREERAARVRVSLPATQWSVEELQPGNWRHVADFLTGLLTRKPIADGQGWGAERLILGCLATELRLMAHEAGEPDGPPREFGQDPVGRAKAELDDLAYLRESDARRQERRLADSRWRSGR